MPQNPLVWKRTIKTEYVYSSSSQAKIYRANLPGSIVSLAIQQAMGTTASNWNLYLIKLHAKYKVSSDDKYEPYNYTKVGLTLFCRRRGREGGGKQQTNGIGGCLNSGKQMFPPSNGLSRDNSWNMAHWTSVGQQPPFPLQKQQDRAQDRAQPWKLPASVAPFAQALIHACRITICSYDCTRHQGPLSCHSCGAG